MSTVSTFGSFTQARLAIYASQAGLSVTGNNIANINTDGYTRQRLDQTSFYAGSSDRYSSKYSLRVGYGTLATGVSQLRDPYLDIRYRNESAGVGYTDTKLAVLEEIESVLDEVGDGEEGFGVIADQLSNLYKMLSQLNDQTGQDEYDILVRTSAETLTNLFRSYASELKEIYNNTADSFNTNVDKVNTILTQIRGLNENIRKAEIHDDKALELRDERNLLLDELSTYIHIDVTTEYESIGAGVEVEKLIVEIAGTDTKLVDGIYARQLQALFPAENTDPNTSATLPYLDANDKPVANVEDAAMVNTANYDITLTPLADSHDRLQYAVVAGERQTVDKATYDANQPSTSVKNADGSFTVTVYTTGTVNRTVQAQNAINPAYYQYTDNKGNYSNDPADLTDPALGYVNNAAYVAGSLPFLDAAGQPTADATYNTTVKEPVYYSQVYTRTPSTEVALGDNTLYGSLQAMREMLTEEGEFASAADLVLDPDAATKRGIPYFQQLLDLMAYQIADTFNTANQGFVYSPADADGNSYYVAASGAPITLAGEAINTDVTKLTQGQKDQLIRDYGNGNTNATDEELRGYLDQYLKDSADGKLTGTANGAQYLGAVLFSNNGNGDDTTEINASNISVSATWAAGPSLVCSFEQYDDLPVGSTDSANILHMMAMMDADQTYDPQDIAGDAVSSNMFVGSFSEYWNNVGIVLGKDMDSTSTLLDTHYAKSVELDTSRDSVSSVDLNDEAMNLTMYQQAYNAACRLMTTLDSVLDKLVNNTGMTT